MDCSDLKNAALGLLARREHSRSELRQKLQQKARRKPDDNTVSDADMDEVLDELEQDGYLSDERFTEMYVRSRISRGFGPERIVRELTEKGVSSAMASIAVEEVEDWAELAREVWQKKFSKAPQNFRDKARQMQFLRYRGFSMREIDQVMRAVGAAD